MMWTGLPHIFVADKNDTLEEFKELEDTNPAMIAYLLAFATMVKNEAPDANTIITDIWRDDKYSVHHYWRGVDLRLYHPNRHVGRARESGPAEPLAEWVLAWLDKCFWYGPDHQMWRIHGEGLNRHIHLQTPDTTRWRM